jgi:hypothetical protein
MGLLHGIRRCGAYSTAADDATPPPWLPTMQSLLHSDRRRGASSPSAYDVELHLDGDLPSQ